eukprot:g32365.t1
MPPVAWTPIRPSSGGKGLMGPFTASAWEKHQQRCDFSMDLPNQPAAVAATPAPVPSPARAKAKASADSKGLAKAAAPGTRYASAARKPLRLLFIRHGESANRTSSSKCSDPGLSEKGQRQAEALGHHLAETLAPEAPGSMGRSARLSVSVSVSEPPKGKGRKRRIWTSSMWRGDTSGSAHRMKWACFGGGFTREGLWDYQGASEKESSEECAERAQRVLQVLQESMSDLWQRSSQPTLPHDSNRAYGSPKYRLKNASVSELQVDPDFKAVKKEISSDLHAAAPTSGSQMDFLD